MLNDKRRRANIELKKCLRKPLSNADTQRLANIFWGDSIYRSIFDEKGNIKRKK